MIGEFEASVGGDNWDSGGGHLTSLSHPTLLPVPNLLRGWHDDEHLKAMIRSPPLAVILGSGCLMAFVFAMMWLFGWRRAFVDPETKLECWVWTRSPKSGTQDYPHLEHKNPLVMIPGAGAGVLIFAYARHVPWFRLLRGLPVSIVTVGLPCYDRLVFFSPTRCPSPIRWCGCRSWSCCAVSTPVGRDLPFAVSWQRVNFRSEFELSDDLKTAARFVALWFGSCYTNVVFFSGIVFHNGPPSCADCSRVWTKLVSRALLTWLRTAMALWLRIDSYATYVKSMIKQVRRALQMLGLPIRGWNQTARSMRCSAHMVRLKRRNRSALVYCSAITLCRLSQC